MASFVSAIQYRSDDTGLSKDLHKMLWWDETADLPEVGKKPMVTDNYITSL